MKTTLLTTLIVASMASLSIAGSPSAKNSGPIAPQEEVRRAIVYDYAEAGYTYLGGGESPTFHGGYVEATISPVDNFFLFGRVAGYGGDANALDASVGAGFYIPLMDPYSTPTIDLTLRAGYGYFDEDGGSQINTLFVAPGFRAMLCPSFEVNGQVLYYHTDDSRDAVALGTGVVYYFSSHFAWATNYSYDLEDESHFVQSGVRYIW